VSREPLDNVRIDEERLERSFEHVLASIAGEAGTDTWARPDPKRPTTGSRS
jgi:hypothetical protein